MDHQESRRDFIIKTGRYATVAAITYAMSDFIIRGIGQECVNESICDACTSVTACELPDGVEYKAQQAKKDAPQKPIELESLPQKELDHG